MIKKFLCVLFATLLCFSFVACRDEKPQENQEVETTANPVDEAKEKLSEAYDTYCTTGDKKYASLGYDKMSLTIDTKPNNSYYKYEKEALTAIISVNRFLEFPSSLTDKMSSTRALDGMQTQECGQYTVTWNYHPDNGMKVIYEINP